MAKATKLGPMRRIAQASVGMTICLLLAGATSAARPMISCTPGPYIVFFEWNSSALHKNAVEILDKAIEGADDCGPMNVVLAGHTDTSEKPPLARQRLQAVSNYFASHGIFVKRRNLQAYGAKAPRVKTPPNTQERQNRRVEITYGPTF